MADSILTSVPEELVNQNTLDAQTPRDIALTAINAYQSVQKKQDKLVAGEGIVIDQNNVISAKATQQVSLDEAVTETSQNGVQSKGIYEFVVNKIKDIIGNAPDTLDTLEEISTYLNEHGDAFLALKETVDNGLSFKQNKFYTGNGIAFDGATLNASSMLFSLQYNIKQVSEEGGSIDSHTVIPTVYAPATQYINSLILDKFGNIGVIDYVSAYGNGENVTAFFYVSYKGNLFELDDAPQVGGKNPITSGAVESAISSLEAQLTSSINAKMDKFEIEQQVTADETKIVSSQAVKNYADAQREEAIKQANLNSDSNDALTLESAKAYTNEKTVKDNVPTKDSINLLSSGAVYNALQNKQDKLYFDNEPTTGSVNLLTSDTIYNALNTKQDKLTAGRGISIINNQIVNTISGNGVITTASATSESSAIVGTYFFEEIKE